MAGLNPSVCLLGVNVIRSVLNRGLKIARGDARGTVRATVSDRSRLAGIVYALADSAA